MNDGKRFYYAMVNFLGGMAALRGGGVVNVPYGRQKERDLTSFAGESGQVPARQFLASGTVCRKQVRQASLKRNGNREHENAKCFIVSTRFTQQGRFWELGLDRPHSNPIAGPKWLTPP
jgi:hypothetical protein